MAQLTWKNVDAPTFSGVTESQRLAADLMSRGFGALGETINGIKKSRDEAKTAGIASQLLRYTDPAAYDAALKNGEINLEGATPEALDFAASRQAALHANQQNFAQTQGMVLGNDGKVISNQQSQLGLTQQQEAYARSQQEQATQDEGRKLALSVLPGSANAEDFNQRIQSSGANPEVVGAAIGTGGKLAGDYFGAPVDPTTFTINQRIEENDKALSGGAIGNTVNKIVGVESSGNANAKNPNSSAEGLGQIIDSTWLGLIKQHRPDIIGDDAQLLALKKDASLNRELTTRLTEDNAKGIAGMGLPVTEGNLYLNHFAGTGGFRAIMGASDEAGLDTVLTSQAMAANPFLAGKTVGWIKDWANKKMGGAPQDIGGTAGKGDRNGAADAIAKAAADKALASNGVLNSEQNQSLIAKDNDLGFQAQTLKNTLQADELVNKYGSTLQALMERDPNTKTSENEVAKQLHAAVGKGIEETEVLDQLNVLSDRYGLPADVVSTIMQGTLTQNDWGTRWLAGEARFSHSEFDKLMQQFIDPDGKNAEQKLKPVLSRMAVFQDKQKTSAAVDQAASQVEKAKLEFFQAQELKKKGRNVDVKKPYQRYVEMQRMLDQALSRGRNNPTTTPFADSNTGR